MGRRHNVERIRLMNCEEAITFSTEEQPPASIPRDVAPCRLICGRRGPELPAAARSRIVAGDDGGRRLGLQFPADR